MSSEQFIAPELELINVDHERLLVKIRSTQKALEDKIAQLNSEDAKTLAIREANKAGLHGAAIKYSSVQYGDATDGTISNKFGAGIETEPFLVVEIYSADIASMRAVGDSSIPASKSY